MLGCQSVSRITLICGSLEPGRDGVGDYCRMLAKALTEYDVHVTLIGINDRHLAVSHVFAHDELRLSGSLSATERYNLAAKAIAKWAPDWISLQFICWGYGWKGIVGHEATLLARLMQGHCRHLMFHETWVGGAPEIIPSRFGKARRRVLGYLQRRSIRSLVEKIRPHLIYTSNAVYQKNLSAISVKAVQLPMFGSVAFEPGADWGSFRELVRANAIVQLPFDRSQVILIGHFGAVRLCPIDAVLRAISGAVKGRRVVLVFFGAIGQHGKAVIKSWRLDQMSIETAIVGPLDLRELSHSFSQLDAAISLHPATVIGRSSAAAALMEHDVPIICAWGNLPLEDDAFFARWSDLLHSADSDLHRLFETPREKNPKPAFSKEAAYQLISDMMGIVL